MSKINPFLQWWLTPYYQYKHYEAMLQTRRRFGKSKFEFVLLNLLIHPIKRRLAKTYLNILKLLTPIKVIGITGSVGKTTTKRMVESILSKVSITSTTKDSIDPVYNIPATILRTPPWAKYLILEMSVEFPGEMDFYLWLAKPDAVIVTNVFPTHTEFFGDESGVAKEKLKLAIKISKGSLVVLNGDNKYTKIKAPGKRVKYFYQEPTNYSKHFNFESDVANANAAAVLTESLGVPKNSITTGLKNFRPAHNRMNVFTHTSGALIIDDSYSNNPEAFRTALKVLKKESGDKRKIIVFGGMHELGSLENQKHNEAARFLLEVNPQRVILVGRVARQILAQVKNDKRFTWVESEGYVDKELNDYLTSDSAVLIKGSRTIDLDKLVGRLSN